MIDPVTLACRFHTLYESLAPQFGYVTRTDTKLFNPESPNGKLMIAVCSQLAAEIRAEAAQACLALRQEGNSRSDAVWDEACEECAKAINAAGQELPAAASMALPFVRQGKLGRDATHDTSAQYPAPAAPDHPHTPECDFDRNASISEGRYVCRCGYRSENHEPVSAPQVRGSSVGIGSASPESLHDAPAGPAAAETPAPWTNARVLDQRDGITHPDLCEIYMAWTDYSVLRDLARDLERTARKMAEALREVVRISDRDHIAWVAAKEALAVWEELRRKYGE